MENLDLSKVKNELEEKTTYELIDILTYSRSNYNVASINILKGILTERGLAKEEIDRADNQYDAIKQNSIKKQRSSFGTYAGRVILFLTISVCIGFYVKRQVDNKPWSLSYTASIYQTIYDEMNRIMVTDSSTIKRVCDCAVSNIKKRYPDGIENENKDSLKAELHRIGEDCGKDPKGTITMKGWIPQTEAEFKRKVIQSPELKKYSFLKREKFAGCYINNMETMYPGGISSVTPVDSFRKAASSCRHLLSAGF
ncbi:hypothetical protein EON73_00865 [bacterium]|nr:MAG: hypothetical protein EON73_00865 [bacterium]